ncbi:hypothetical protein [Deinococcus sp.]|uniref:hypothetical protein n=1 Tax=Deinococcus sp. TaxID=47478 RepID=UPI003CC6A463
MTDKTDGDVQYRQNVPQERVQDNENWDTGTPKNPGEAAKEEYWDDTSDANKEEDAGTGTGSASQG